MRSYHDTYIDPQKYWETKLKPVIDWAKNKIGLEISFAESPNQHYWQGTRPGFESSNKLYLGGNNREHLICHEIGHYVVCPPDRRKLFDYGLEFYKAIDLSKIISSGLHNRHTMEDGRAGVFGYYLSKHLGMDEFIDSLFHNNPTLDKSHKLVEAKAWLIDNDILDATYESPTGNIFGGQWELDDPYVILGRQGKNDLLQGSPQV